MTIIDAHQHFWRYNEREYGWMGEIQDVLKRDHLPAELAGLMEAAGVNGTVAVQARRTLDETRWLLELAAEHEFILGVVGWVDFGAADLEATLEQLSANPLLKGVRELIHDMPDPEYAVSPVHVAGVQAAGRAGLAYDLLLKPPHLVPATRLVDLLPEQRFVVDHIAKPDISKSNITDGRGANRLEPWAGDIRELALRPNVYCKLSGLVTEADWQTWQPADFTPYLDVVLDAFGTSRVMIGSDWPVCTCAADYNTTIGLVRDYSSILSEDERHQVLAANSCEFYGLELPGEPTPDEGTEGH